ncbi:hypothetical protein E2562_021797 [Oryza meyeriana var. granulata]|uniref:Uncharacterized protein n=1 Tax=Oryza meyeriana var. granulata TaxID=110450 RepID=A0A6G1EN79_9ORYZ|nr:hypothetical protein E2562_021797 [Oryza meyeriana var. granulata]
MALLRAHQALMDDIIAAEILLRLSPRVPHLRVPRVQAQTDELPEKWKGKGSVQNVEKLEAIVVDRANLGIFMIELKSKRAKKVAEGGKFYNIFPYMSFCTPDPLILRNPHRSLAAIAHPRRLATTCPMPLPPITRPPMPPPVLGASPQPRTVPPSPPTPPRSKTTSMPLTLYRRGCRLHLSGGHHRYLLP